VNWVQAGLRRPYVLSQGLDVTDQSPVQGVARQGAGVRCRRWEGCQESSGRGVFAQWEARQLLVGTRRGGGKNLSPDRDMLGLVAGVGWIGCRQGKGGQQARGPEVPVGGWIGDASVGVCWVRNEGIGSRSVMVSGRPRDGQWPMKGIRCPEDSVGWGGVMNHPLRPGEDDHWCWEGSWGRWNWWPGWEGV